MSEDPFKNYSKKSNDSKKRDFMVKKLKKEREALHLQRQRQWEEEDNDDEEEEYTAPARAGAIVLVKNSYLTQSLFQVNHSLSENLPKKWRKADQVSSEEEEEDDDDDDSDDDEEDDENDQGDDENYEDDVDEEARKNKLLNSKAQKIDKNDVYTESEDEDESAHEHTQRRVVQIIEAFNEIELIDEEPAVINGELSHDYKTANTVATKSMRVNSRSPRLGAEKSPKISSNPSPRITGTSSPRVGNNNHGDNDIDELSPLSLGNSTTSTTSTSQRSKLGKQDQKQKDLKQQLQDLDLQDVLRKHSSPDYEPAEIPHPNELDSGVWWKFILDRGATIRSNGTFSVQVVKNFPAAQTHDFPESYFHFNTDRKSQPDKPLTAFGLFKQHKLAGNDDGDDNNNDDVHVHAHDSTATSHAAAIEAAATTDEENNHGTKQKVKGGKKQKNLQDRKAGRSKQTKNNTNDTKKTKISDAAFKTMFFALPEEELVDYYVLALVEKIRYKCQRVEYLYEQSTQIKKSKKT